MIGHNGIVACSAAAGISQLQPDAQIRSGPGRAPLPAGIADQPVKLPGPDQSQHEPANFSSSPFVTGISLRAARGRFGVPGPGAIYRSQTLNFHAPVKIGDVVEVIVEVVELTPKGRTARLRCEALVDRKVVLDGEALVSVPPRSATRAEP